MNNQQIIPVLDTALNPIFDNMIDVFRNDINFPLITQLNEKVWRTLFSPMTTALYMAHTHVFDTSL